MKKVCSLLMFLLVTFLFVAVGWAKVSEDSMKQEVMKSYGKLPLYFIQNDGQIDNKVKYYTKGSGHSVFFTDEGVYVSLSRKEGDFKKEGRLKGKDELIEKEAKITVETVKLRPLNAKETPEIVAEEMFTGKVNYFRGNDPSKWKSDIPTYGKVRYKEVYPGIDIVFYGNQSQLEYDVVVKPGADYKVVKFEYEGIKELKVNKGGELVAVLSSGLDIIQKKPYIYQEIEGKKIEIDGRYEIENKEGKYYFSFKVSNYNPQYALVIDPVLAYSTYLGGSGEDRGYDIAVDTSGNAYVTGYTGSTNFPTQNAFDSTHNGNRDVFVTKLSSTGSLVYSTYLGGGGWDMGYGIAVDTSGNAYVTGYTYSTDFPTQNAFDSSYNGGWSDVFVTKLSSSGSLIYSTYLGGSLQDEGWGIAVDTSDNAYVTGYTWSTNFPTQNAFDSSYNGHSDAFVVKLSPTGSSLIYSTYLGGYLWDEGRGIAVDTSGNAYVTGTTSSTDFPTTQNAFDSSHNGDYDVFVTKIAFSQQTQYALTVTKSGTGTGTVTASGCTLSWSGNTGTCTVNSETVITLSASAASGSTFAGWSGACSGTGTCTLTMDAAKNVTATFNTQTCTYTISPTSLNTGASAVTGNINVTTASGCTWTAVSNASWITITSGSSGTGSGAVSYSVSANSGTYRTGTITVGGQTHTVRQSDTVFADVDSSMWSKNYIEAIYNNEITIGCIQSPIRYYCPLSSVTRGQMAAFIIRAKYGKNFTYPTTPYFSDVPANNDFFKYVQRLKQDNITRQEGIYRVNDPVTRGEMAALIIRAKYEDNFTYPTTAYFSDVPPSNPFFTYVQRLKQDNITRQEGIYRVNDAVSREEMAAFISRAFLGME